MRVRWLAGVFRTSVLVIVASCTTAPAPEVWSSPAGAVSFSALSARAVHTATVLASGEVLVAGGCVVDGCATATDTVAVVGVGGPRWVDPLRNARDAHTATAMRDGSVLVTGGFGGEGQPPLRSAEVFSAGAAGWTPAGELTLGRGGHAAALLGDGRVLVAGGWVRSRTYTDTVELFDPATMSFAPGPALPVAVDGLAAVSLPDGSVLITGGQSAPGVAADLAVLISPDGQRSEAVGPLSTARFKHTMVTLPGGEVLVLGGTSDDRELLRSTEIYDPVARSFRPGPGLIAGRYKLAGGAALLPDGRVLVAGGGPGLEIVDLQASVSTPVADGGDVRSSFSTVSVLGDVVLALGGYDERIALTGTELRIPLAELPGQR